MIYVWKNNILQIKTQQNYHIDNVHKNEKSVSGDRNSTGALSSPAPSVALSCQVVHPHHCNRHHLPYHVTCQAAHPHHHTPHPPHYRATAMFTITIARLINILINMFILVIIDAEGWIFQPGTAIASRASSRLIGGLISPLLFSILSWTWCSYQSMNATA